MINLGVRNESRALLSNFHEIDNKQIELKQKKSSGYQHFGSVLNGNLVQFFKKLAEMKPFSYIGAELKKS